MKLHQITTQDITNEALSARTLFEAQPERLHAVFGSKSVPAWNSLPFEENLQKLLSFSKGEATLPEAGDICRTLGELFWIVPEREDYLINWTVWEQTIIGIIVKAAQARIKLNDGEDLLAPEVAALSGLTRDSINKYTRSGKLKADMTGSRKWLYTSEVVTAFLNEGEHEDL